MTSLLDMPLELLVQISTYVTTPDLSALRLTCKELERSLWEWFADEFFVKKQFMMTHPSLQALVDISHHPSLSKKLRHVIISTHVYDESDATRSFRDQKARDIYMRASADQEYLMKNGIHRERLTEAFTSLENLETIDVRDFNASRQRDGTEWQSWGVATLYELTGHHPGLYHNYSFSLNEAFLANLFSALFCSLGLAGRTLPKFQVLFRKGTTLPDAVFFLPDFVFPAIQPVLRELKVLHLTVSFSGQQQPASEYSRHLRQFLNCTRDLTELRLNFQKSVTAANEDFLLWFGTSPTSPIQPPQPTRIGYQSLPPAALPQLKTLELGFARTSPEPLLSTIRRFAPTLEKLSLWRISFPTQDRPGDYAQWTQFLRDVSLIPLPALSLFKLGGLSHYSPNRMIYHDVVGRDKTRIDREYSGDDMSGFLQALADEIIVTPPVVRNHSVADLGTDSDEEQDDEQDDQDEDEEEWSESD